MFIFFVQKKWEQKSGAEISLRTHGLAQRSSIKYSNWCHTNVIFFFLTCYFPFKTLKRISIYMVTYTRKDWLKQNYRLAIDDRLFNSTIYQFGENQLRKTHLQNICYSYINRNLMLTVLHSEHTCRLHFATIFQVSILKLKGQLLEINIKWAHIIKH